MTRGDPISGTAYKRFIILSGPRTGSNMLASALNSHPGIACFRELFNQRESISYGVDGYDATSAEDLALRAQSPNEFLSNRIFRPHPENVEAVGFKFHYTHHWGFPGIRQLLEEDEAILVIHLQRHNHLRVLVSLKVAEETGIYIQHTGGRARIAGAITGLVQRLRRSRPQASQIKLEISPDELRQFGLQKDMQAKQWERIFSRHQIFDVSYEDMAQDPQEEFARTQSFLGVTPSTLTVGLRRQNPQKLEELIENFAELRDAFVGSPAEWMFAG